MGSCRTQDNGVCYGRSWGLAQGEEVLWKCCEDLHPCPRPARRRASGRVHQRLKLLQSSVQNFGPHDIQREINVAMRDLMAP